MKSKNQWIWMPLVLSRIILLWWAWYSWLDMHIKEKSQLGLSLKHIQVNILVSTVMAIYIRETRHCHPYIGFCLHFCVSCLFWNHIPCCCSSSCCWSIVVSWITSKSRSVNNLWYPQRTKISSSASRSSKVRRIFCKKRWFVDILQLFVYFVSQLFQIFLLLTSFSGSFNWMSSFWESSSSLVTSILVTCSISQRFWGWNKYGN